MKYIIGTGWWCAQGEDDENVNRVKYGDETIRGKGFHKLWYESVTSTSSPDKIVMIDSCSPVKPDFDQADTRIEFVSLNENPGHSTGHSGKYSGWTRSVLLSLAYAANCDCDYYVYVEQDVLLKGKGIIEYEISKANRPYVFGFQDGLVQPLQQSFFIIKRSHIETFLLRMMSIKTKDNRLSPERKFAIATSWVLSHLPEFLFYQPNLNSVVGKIVHRIQTAGIKLFARFDTLKSGYGRMRPIDFDDPFFYFQHGDTQELKKYMAMTDKSQQGE